MKPYPFPVSVIHLNRRSIDLQPDHVRLEREKPLCVCATFDEKYICQVLKRSSF